MEKNYKEKIGTVKIGDGVLSVIAALSATEADGVVCMAGGLTHEMITKSDLNNLSRAVRVNVEEGEVSVKVALVLDGTVSIPAVSASVEEKVSNAIESMTGMKVSAVFVSIAGVNV